MNADFCIYSIWNLVSFVPIIAAIEGTALLTGKLHVSTFVTRISNVKSITFF